MNSYFGYIRVSTARQGEGVSLDQQRSAIEAYARSHALSIAGWFEEQESASKRGRPVFGQMIAALEERRVTGVIIHKIDRSARHLADWVWVGGLIDRGVDVRFVHENLDLTSRSGRLTGDLLAVIAADYSRNLRDEVKKGIYGRLKQGIYPFHAPVGYLDQGGGKAKATDPIKAPLVRQAFELYASGAYTLKSLRLELHRRGLRQHSGRPLALDSVSRLLNNPFYIGIIKLRRSGQTFEGLHPPLIAKALFDRVQRVLHGKTNTKVIVHDFVFRRMISCAGCGHALTGERQKGHVYYRCHQPACRGVSIREDDALLKLRWFNQIVALTAEELGDLRDLVDKSRGDQAAARAAEDARLKRKLQDHDARLDRLTDALVDGVLDNDSFVRRKEALLNDRRAILDQLNQPNSASQAEQTLEKFELGNAAYIGVISEDPREIRQGLRETTSNLSLEGKSLVITPRSPFREVAISRIRQQSGLDWVRLRTDGRIRILRCPDPDDLTFLKLDVGTLRILTDDSI